MRPPNGLYDYTQTNGPKDGDATPWQILDADLFWWSHWLRWNFDVKPRPLASLWNYLSMHMWTVKNRVRICPGRLFYSRLVLEAESDSNLSWIEPLTWLGRPCWSSSPPHLPPCTSWSSSMFLSMITSLGCNLFLKLWKGSLNVGVSNHRLVNLWFAHLVRMVCSEDTRIYTGSSEISLHPVCYCLCY